MNISRQSASLFTMLLGSALLIWSAYLHDPASQQRISAQGDALILAGAAIFERDNNPKTPAP